MRGLVTLCLSLMLWSGSAQAGRLALVIGNADYASLPDLEKTLNDSAGYRDALAELGFDVSYHTDLDRAGLDRAVAGFLDKTQPGDEAVFVYAGHGWSDGRTNFLLPTDTPDQGSETMLARWSLPLKNGATGLLDEIARRGARLQVSVIDACRSNPFRAVGNTRAAGRTRGLTLVSPPRGAFVIYSAGTGEEALDSLPSDGADERYSVFTRVFLPLLRSGVPLEQAIGRAQVETAALARRIGHQQSPAYYDETLGETCLRAGGCPAGLAITPAPIPAQPVRPAASYDPAKTAYEDAKRRGTREALEAVAQFFPETYWGAIAKQEAAALSPKVALVTPSAREPESETRCDRLAGSPNDPDGPEGFKGVAVEMIDRSRAVAACSRDVARYPDSRRQRTALGRAYLARKRYSEAREHLDAARAAGSAAAAAELGWMAMQGLGRSTDHGAALAFFEQGSAADLPVAFHGLGVMARDGLGMARDSAKAIDYLERAATAGYRPALTELGLTYADGLGTPIDNRKASKWLNYAMRMGDPKAVTRYGRMHLDGQGMDVRYETARGWLEQAYEDGDGDAALYLGDIYRDGLGVVANRQVARRWYRRARAFGNADAAERMRSVPR